MEVDSVFSASIGAVTPRSPSRHRLSGAIRKRSASARNLSTWHLLIATTVATRSPHQRRILGLPERGGKVLSGTNCSTRSRFPNPHPVKNDFVQDPGCLNLPVSQAESAINGDESSPILQSTLGKMSKLAQAQSTLGGFLNALHGCEPGLPTVSAWGLGSVFNGIAPLCA